MSEKEIIHALLSSDLFANLTTEELVHFLQTYAYKIETYKKGDIFALAGDQVNKLNLVLEGALLARMVSDSGKYILIDRIDSGRIVAPALLFATKNSYPVEVTPEGNVILFSMRKEEFLLALKSNENLLHHFIQIVSDIIPFLSGKIHSLSLKTIRGKLAEYLLAQSQTQGGTKTISLQPTRQELADKFAVSRQSLVRSLTELESEGLIHIHGKKITLLNLAQLKEVE